MNFFLAAMVFVSLSLLAGGCGGGEPVRKGPPDPNVFQPFGQLGNLTPGVSRVFNVKALLGPPENTEFTMQGMVRMDDGTPRMFGGHKLLQYESKGLGFIITRDNLDQADPVITNIYIEALYKGRSTNGLYMGMPKEEALAICRRDYHEKGNEDEKYYFTPAPGVEDSFIVLFEDGMLNRITMRPHGLTATN